MKEEKEQETESNGSKHNKSKSSSNNSKSQSNTSNSDSSDDEEEEFNGITTEMNCCVEMENNNKVYIHYEKDWTIKHLIQSIVNHREFKRLYPTREWMLHSKKTLEIFDLHIALYRLLKPDHETKINFGIKLESLHQLGLLKNNKYPFFIFKGNKNRNSRIEIGLPRVDSFYYFAMHPDIKLLYQMSKKGINTLSKFNLSPLISENKDLDWFIYDDESMNFLMSIQKEEISPQGFIKFAKDKVYFEDQYPLNEIYLKAFLITVSYYYSDNATENLTRKLRIEYYTTGMDVLLYMQYQMKKKYEIDFEPCHKIFKVKGLNDYIFNMNIPLVNFAHINECFNENKPAEYLILDRPKDNEFQQEENETIFQTKHQDRRGVPLTNLMNIGLYDQGKKSKKSHSNDKSTIQIPVSYLNIKDNETIDQGYYSVDYQSNIMIKKGNSMSDQSRKRNNDLLIRHLPENNPNVFLRKEREKIDFRVLNNKKKEAIPLHLLRRPFGITLRHGNWKTLLKDANYNRVMITVQLYNGYDPYSEPQMIKWKRSIHDFNPSLNKKIYLNRYYHNLPDFISLLVTLKAYHKSKSSTQPKIAWATFFLFDHNKQLKTGIHKLCLFNRPLTYDSYFSFYDNTDPDASTIYLEFESFSRPVKYNPTQFHQYEINRKSIKTEWYNIGEFLDIFQKSPFDELTPFEKKMLWKRRYDLCKYPTILTKLLDCIDYSNPKDLMELENILSIAEPLTGIQALNLLTGKYLHESIRAFAVYCLERESPLEIHKYLLQLVQGLKYEKNHDSALGRFILSIAIQSPLTIGHSFFWSLRSEMFFQTVQQRFGLYLECFLNKIGPQIRNVFLDEDDLMKELMKISSIPKQEKVSLMEKDEQFKAALQTLNDKISKEISLPLNFKFRLKGIVVNKCKVMASKKLPLWLNFINADEKGANIVVMFKQGDDLRMDMITMQLFKIMQGIWCDNCLMLNMNLYSVVCTGYEQGMLEMVKESVTIAGIHSSEGGALQSFKDECLKRWALQNASCSMDKFVINFLHSNVAYAVATFILGIGDRHSDNIMMKYNGELFHIDFGHFLGHFKKKLGIKREKAPFIFTKQFMILLGGKDSEKYKEFKEKMMIAYQMIRDNKDTIITLFKALLCAGIPELTKNSIRFLEKTLLVHGNEEEGNAFIMKNLDVCVSDQLTNINFWVHIIANQIKDRKKKKKAK